MFVQYQTIFRFYLNEGCFTDFEEEANLRDIIWDLLFGQVWQPLSAKKGSFLTGFMKAKNRWKNGIVIDWMCLKRPSLLVRWRFCLE